MYDFKFDKTTLTTEQFIKDMYEMDKVNGEWAEYLVNERKMSAKECLETLQRMVNYVQANK